MNPEDRALLDRVLHLHSTLTQRAVLLSHFRSDPDVFTEGMRDLGLDFQDLGAEILRRVTELDTMPTPRPPRRPTPLAGRLSELAL
jgi:hypothetical protein